VGVAALIAVIILAVALRGTAAPQSPVAGVPREAPLDQPAEGRSLGRVAAPALAAVLVAVWLAVYPHTPDLAAQVYRVGLFGKLGLAVWDEHWYAGHHLPGYSLLFPAFGTLVGIRAAGAICVLASTLLFVDLTGPFFGRGAWWGSGAFAVAAVGDIWLGRMAFALGVSLALAAGVAFRRGHPLWAALLAVLCASASPVAGLLLGLAGLTLAVSERAWRPLVALALAPALVVLPLTVLFPEGGSEPFPILSFAATALVVIGFLLAVPKEARLLRIGGGIYLLACLACLAVKTPVGSNIERYGVLLAAPLLLCALLSPERSEGSGRRGGSTVLAGLALSAIAVWVLWGPVRETEAIAHSPATSAAYYLPVEHFLDGVQGGPFRVEVPLTRSHWEAALLAPKVSLARGWEKQLDTRYDGVLLRGGLDARSYAEWLHREAVAYVALPDVQLDPSSAREGRLIESGLPYLREVYSSAHWRIYAVQGATPVVSGPGRLTRLGHDSFTVQASSAGSFMVRIHFTRYWTITEGSGCIARGPEGFTELTARKAGAVTVAARFSLARAFESGSGCS
jgi:hypothetical protein